MQMKIWFLSVVDSASTLIYISNFIQWLSFQAFQVTDELRNINKIYVELQLFTYVTYYTVFRGTGLLTE